MKQSFSEFLDKKSRDGRRHLAIIRDVLHKGGMRVADFIERSEDPYLFLHNTEPDATFNGVRIYNIGSGLAFRVQREETTHPYGTAYALDIPNMFADLVEDMSQEEAGKKVMGYIIKELQKFFVLSARAEDEIGSFAMQVGGDPFDKMIISSQGTDQSRQVGNSISPVGI